jgi:hypothetical protein
VYRQQRRTASRFERISFWIVIALARNSGAVLVHLPTILA